MNENLQLERIRAVKARHERALLGKKNVVGIGVGYRQKGGESTGEMVLTVMVRRKERWNLLNPADRIPSELDGVQVDVQEVGAFRAF